jgi:hypothetical protein
LSAPDGDLQWTHTPDGKECDVSETRGGSSGCWKYGCVAMLLMFAGGIGAAMLLGMRGRREIEPKVERFFKNVEAGDFRTEYDAASSVLKAREQFSTFSHMLVMTSAALGPLTGRTFEGISVSRDGSTSTLTATYDCTFEKSRAKVVFVFIAEEGEYRLARVSYRSPGLRARSACPHCGAITKQADKFCASCGRELPSAPSGIPDAPARPATPGGTEQEF